MKTFWFGLTDSAPVDSIDVCGVSLVKRLAGLEGRPGPVGRVDGLSREQVSELLVRSRDLSQPLQDGAPLCAFLFLVSCGAQQRPPRTPKPVGWHVTTRDLYGAPAVMENPGTTSIRGTIV